MKDKDILGYLKEKAQRFAEHGNKILMCSKIKQWGFITYYKKVAQSTVSGCNEGNTVSLDDFIHDDSVRIIGNVFDNKDLLYHKF